MIALNIALMTLVAVGIVSLLAWAIASDRRSKRTSGGELAPAAAPLHHNLVMPRELRSHGGRAHTAHTAHATPAARPRQSASSLA
jgi:hypothetical protein